MNINRMQCVPAKRIVYFVSPNEQSYCSLITHSRDCSWNLVHYKIPVLLIKLKGVSVKVSHMQL